MKGFLLIGVVSGIAKNNLKIVEIFSTMPVVSKKRSNHIFPQI
jgi:hypothetical protein